MSVPVRRSMAVAALSSLALVSLVSAPATADDGDTRLPRQEPGPLDALTVASEVTLSRVARADATGPQDHAGRAERAELRESLRQSRRELRELVRELKDADPSQRREVLDEVAAERAELRAQLRLLHAPVAPQPERP